MKKKFTTNLQINTNKMLKIVKCKLSVAPKKSLGQNFLVNRGVLDKIVAAAEIQKDDIILEVGPGTGKKSYCCWKRQAADWSIKN